MMLMTLPVDFTGAGFFAGAVFFRLYCLPRIISFRRF